MLPSYTIAAIIGTTFTLLTPSLAVPQPLHPRDAGLPGGAFVCDQPQFTGHCQWVPPSDTCHIAGGGSFAPDSFGPDAGGHCVLYSDSQCKGAQVSVLQYPGMRTGVKELGVQGFRCFVGGWSGVDTPPGS